jgi:anti-sigma factor RsiW
MLNNGNNSNCDLVREMISYLYDESTEPERQTFEAHLVVCVACTDEFASIANARFSLFEWRKEEFAPLVTPEIVIPYQTRDQAVVDEVYGLFGGLRGIFSMPRFAFSAATIFALLGFGFVGASYLGDRQIADVILLEENASPPAMQPELAVADAPAMVGPASATSNRVTEPKRTMESKPEPVRTADKRLRISRSFVAVTKKPVGGETGTDPTQQRKAPVLNNFEDSDDKSLRLADLFADGGSKR